MTVLNFMVCHGRPLNSHNLRANGGVATGANAAGHLDTLLDGDEVIFVSVTPDHHFTVFPLAHEVGLLQGFYNLHTWITTSNKTKFTKANFKLQFRNIFSASSATRDAATTALFALPGGAGNITGYFHKALTPVAVVSASANLFHEDATKASLAPVQN